MRPPASESAPRLARAVGLQLVLLAAVALGSDLPWTKKPAPEPPAQVQKPKPVEHRLRVVRLPPPEKPAEKQSEKVAAQKPPESPKRLAQKPPPPKPPEPPAKP